MAAKRYPQPPRTKAVPAFNPPAWMSEAERESFIDGYLAWCSGRYEDRAKLKR